MKKLLSLALLISMPAFSSHNEDSLEKTFKGNWTATFTLKDGSTCEHTPQFTALGFMRGGKGINLQAKKYNGLPMSEKGLKLETDSTKEAFTEALRESGLYQ